jgi:hypothetical protein
VSPQFSPSAPGVEAVEIVEPVVEVIASATFEANSSVAPQRSSGRTWRRTNPLARVPSGTPRWGYPGSPWFGGESRAALMRHLASDPHYYQRSYLETLSTRQLERLHSGEHEKDARVTGNRSRYYPNSGRPFYGSLQ